VERKEQKEEGVGEGGEGGKEERGEGGGERENR